MTLASFNAIQQDFSNDKYKLSFFQRALIFLHPIPEAILYLYLAKYGFPLIFGIHIIINIGIAFYYSILTKTDFKAHLFKLFLFMVIPNLVLYSMFPILERILI
ncbi:MAG: hypothetical protein QW757_03970 [Candidatus Woesearchaeota archaeon]